MAAIHNNRIAKKYGDIKDKFTGFLEKILARNYEEIHKQTITIQSSLISNELKKIKQEITQQKNLSETMRKIRIQEHAINIPNLIDIDTRIIWADKARERGKMITDSLKEQITNNIKSVVSKPEYTRTRGKLTGTLKDQAILDIKDKMKKTFKNYTKIDPTIGIPRNIKAIVTTETRSIVNQTKHDYTQALLDDNPDIHVIKRWIHSGNVWGSKNYKARRYHKQLHGTEMPFNQNFKIKDDKTGVVYLAPRPHDDSLPVGEIIGCNCNLQYIARKERVRENKEVKKAWQLKSGKWHDYDSSGKVVEVSAPGQKEKKVEEKPEDEIEKPEEIKENNVEKLLKENEDFKGLENLKNEINKYDNVNDFIENNKPIYGKRNTRYWNGKVYGWIGMDSISAMQSAEMNWQHRNQKVFYRTTNNKDEYLVENLKSKNHLTGDEYEGMSTWYNQSYFSEGNEVQPRKKPKYIGIVTGDISSFGDDGEPILQNVKWIQKPIEKLPKKYEDLEVVDYDTPAPWAKLDIGLFGKDVIRDYAPSKDQLAEFYNKYKNKEDITKSQTTNLYKTLDDIQSQIQKAYKVEKKWQLESGKWHDYDENRNIIEVPAPGKDEPKETDAKKPINEKKIDIEAAKRKPHLNKPGGWADVSGIGKEEFKSPEVYDRLNHLSPNEIEKLFDYMKLDLTDDFAKNIRIFTKATYSMLDILIKNAMKK